MNPNSEPQNPFAAGGYQQTVGQLASEVQMNFIRKTYVLLLAGILACIVMGAVTLNVAPVLMLSLSLLKVPLLAFGALIGASIGAQVLAQKPGLDIVALFGFSSFFGFLLSPVIAMSGAGVVGQAGMLTVIIFGALTAYVFITKKDFSFLGGLLFIGMISLIAGGVLNALFFKNFSFSYFISWGVLFMSSGFVLYQTSNLVHEYRRDQAGAAALGLFVSFMNIFMSLLNILGGDRD